MRLSFRLVWCFVLALVPVSCASAIREGLSSESPLHGTVVPDAGALPQGIAIGDVGPTSALLWVRTDGPALVQVEWAMLSMRKTVSKMGTVNAPVSRTPQLTTAAEADYTLSIPLEGLVPASRYRYRVLVGLTGKAKNLIDVKVAAKGEFTTWPDARTSAPVVFAWGADLGGQGRCRQGVGGYPIFDVMRRQNLNFFLFLGDTIYSDDTCPSPPNEPGAEFQATTLPEYRARHRYQRGAASLRRFLETVPVYVTWDDHEVRNNFAGSFDEHMPTGRQALREYWPIVSPMEDQNRLYRTVRYGADLEIFILDTRQYRSRNAERDGPAKTMLGLTQLQWLLDGLSSSTATWKVVATSVPLSVPKGGGMTVPGYDGWAGGPDGTGFERERQVIVDSILAHKVWNVVFIAGDVHWIYANAYDPNQDGIIDFHEFGAGPLSAYLGRVTPVSEELHPTRLVNEAGYHNFGLVSISTTSFEVRIVDDAGDTRFIYHLTAR